MIRVLLAALLTTLALGAARAAELVYVFDPGCPYCRQWDERIGPIYPRSPEGRRAPLRPIDRRSAELATLKLAQPIRYTPTFVLVVDGAEIGRIEGYAGEDFFWGRLVRLMEMLPAEAGR